MIDKQRSSQTPIPGWNPVAVQTGSGIETRWIEPTSPAAEPRKAAPAGAGTPLPNVSRQDSAAGNQRKET